jgi:hypothetical protein
MTAKGKPRLIERTKVFVRSGAFLKGFKEDCPSTSTPHFPQYAEKVAYRPTDLGWVTVNIRLTKHHPKDRDEAGKGFSDVRQEITLSY